ncbi:hypothetical protein A4S06_07210 [Erysipelotrichaceae bacterium MTC7]|nr:hypothetical protein A4S06_07210 [Erysipelotrichaceae bacterium MTC7]
MKEQKRNYYFTKILEFFLENEIVTTDDISKAVKISEKTTRTKIAEINNYLVDNQLGKICKKPRIGNWLDANEVQRTKIRQVIYNNEELLTIPNRDERMYEVLSYIFKNRKKEVITTTKLSNHLYLSVPTVLKVIQDCKLFFEHYNIELKNTRNDGLIIIFTESNYRNALRNVIVRNPQKIAIERNIMDILPGVRLEKVKRIMLDCESQWKIEFSDDSFYEILVYFCIAISRCNRGTFKMNKVNTKTLEKYHEYSFTKAIFEKIENDFQLSFKKEEIDFLVIQILCSRFVGDEVDLDDESVLNRFDERLVAFTDELLIMISTIIDLDLSDDLILRNGLLNHLRSTLFRMEYGKSSSNSMLYYIKSEYRDLFRQLWSTSVLFEKHFNFKMTEDELGFICLYIQAAIERKQLSARLLIVSNLPNSMLQLAMQKINRAFPEIIEIKVTGTHDFRVNRYEGFDIILTTSELDTTSNQVLFIPELLGDGWINEISNKVKEIKMNQSGKAHIFDSECHQLFSPELIFTRINVKDKKELLKLMCARLLQKGLVASGFENSVLEREQATTTEIGNGVALPHGNQRYVNEPKVVVAVLDKPILWDREEVEIVFLLAIRMGNDQEKNVAQLFYKQYVSLVDENKKIEKIKSMKSNVDLYKYLIS